MHLEASPSPAESGEVEVADALRASRAQLERDYRADWQTNVRKPQRSARRARQRASSRPASAVAPAPVRTQPAGPPIRLSAREVQQKHVQTFKGSVSTFLADLEKNLPSSLDTNGAPSGPSRLLTAKEERALIRLIDHARDPAVPLGKGARCVHASLDSIAALHSVSLDQASEIVGNARRARELVLLYHWRLVHYCAHKFGSGHASHLDLFAEGLQGLPAALDTFDPKYNVRFHTHAFYRVKASILTFVTGSTSMLLPSAHDYSQLKRVRTAQAKLARERDERGALRYRSLADVPLRRIAADTGMQTQIVARVLTSARAEVSLDAPTKQHGGDVGETLIATLAADEADSDDDEDSHPNHVFGVADAAVIRGSFATVLQTLDPRERNVMRLRYGLNKEGVVVPRSRIAEAYGVSRSVLWSIEKDALRKLGAPWRREYLEKACGKLLQDNPRVSRVPPSAKSVWGHGISQARKS